MTAHSAIRPASPIACGRINPDLVSEAEWLDGPLSEQDMADLAARKGLPLYVPHAPREYVQPRREPNIEGMRRMVLAAEFHVRDCERQLADARLALTKRLADLEAATRGEAA